MTKNKYLISGHAYVMFDDTINKYKTKYLLQKN